MELDLITMPRLTARAAFIEYRHAVQDRHRTERADVERRLRTEDEALMRGYRALSMGKQLLRLSDAIRQGGEDEQLRPRLGLARADEVTIQLTRDGNGRVTYEPATRWPRVRPTKHQNRVLTFPTGARAIRNVAGQLNWQVQATATVPTVPPQYRPAAALANYHILFEAQWRSAPRASDPALLRHLGGDLWVVLATWDVTPLEAAVLGMRRA